MEISIDPRPGDGSPRFGRDDLRLFGRYVRERRAAGGITLRELSEKSGVSIAAIRSLETGGANPSLPTVIQVIEALGTTIDRALAAVRATDEDHVLRPVHELTAMQRPDCGLIDLTGRKVKAGEILVGREPCGLHVIGD